MNSCQKQVIAVIFGLLLCFHFFSIVLYTVPVKLNCITLKKLSSVYCYPYFHQSWQMFVPTPITKQALYVRFREKNGGYSAWRNILQQEIIKHREHRFSGYENTVLLFSNSLIYLKGALPTGSHVYHEPPANIEFTVVAHEVSQWLKYEYARDEITHYEVLLTFEENGFMQNNYFLNLTSN